MWDEGECMMVWVRVIITFLLAVRPAPRGCSLSAADARREDQQDAGQLLAGTQAGMDGSGLMGTSSAAECGPSRHVPRQAH
jgi:hypothetical protein